jgi:hypothetical protein
VLAISCVFAGDAIWCIIAIDAPLKGLPGRGAGFHTKQNPTGFHGEETVMAYECAGRVRHGRWSRRSFMKVTAAGLATGVMGSTLQRRAAAADGLRSIGLGVSEINEIQDKATKDLGFSIAGQAMGYGECLT